MPRSWTITVPMATPSLNRIQNNHWAVIRKGKQDMQSAVAVALLGLNPAIPKAEGKRSLTIIRHGLKSLDADNLAGGCKGLIDALKLKGIIVDDDAAHLSVSFHQVANSKSTPHTVVLIEEAQEISPVVAGL